jgi:predicted phage terminase large subunit-like protein
VTASAVLEELDAIEAEVARRSLRRYLEAIWPIVEPATTFTGGFHIDAIAEHLEAVTARQIRNLVISIPPRHTKSLLASIAWPTWTWATDPSLRFLTASYSAALSLEHAVLSRRVIESDWYRAHFPGVVLTTDQNVKSHYENTDRGYRMATSVGGTVTGRGGDFLITDDPHNLEEVYSEPIRTSVTDWYRKVWSSRLNDPKRGCRVVIMQRGHEKDLAGVLIESGEYEHLCLPTEYNPKKSIVTSIGWRDPRTEPGQLLCPERFGAAENAQAKATLGSMDYAAQHGQDPQPEGGHLFKREWFSRIVDVLPADVVTWCRGWDGAASDGKGDWTVGLKMGRTSGGQYVVAHIERGQFGPAEADRVLKSTAEMDGLACRQREEEEGGSSGKKVSASHAILLAGYDYRAERATGDKMTRARPFRAQCEAGNVLLLKAAWNRAYIDELCGFPFGDHDDQVDASSLAFNELALGAPVITPIPLRGV